MHVPENAQSACEHFQFWLQRAFASDEKFRAGIVLLKNCKSAQAGGHAFLWNQSACLDYFPFPVSRRFSIDKGEFIERDSSAIKAQLFGGASQLGQSFGERLGAGEDEWDSIEQTLQLSGVIFNLRFMRDIGAMERYDTRFMPLLNKRKQVHASMAEINMHEISAVPS